MTISAKIILDSTDITLKHRITTWAVTYPRFIHAEMLTHRIFSRNASSSRAIPVLKQLARIEADPAMPIEWGLNQPGMQAGEELTPEQQELARSLWLEGCRYAVDVSRRLAALNVHKQIANRVAEAFSHITVIVTATEWANFFNLRHHPMAQPEFRALAEAMAPLYRDSVPRVMSRGEWHLPFVTFDDEVLCPDLLTLIKCSAARCARVSYLNHDGSTPSIAKDLELYDRLVGGKPLHASPVEHQATPFVDKDLLDSAARDALLLFDSDSVWSYPFDTKWKDPVPWSANFRGFFQYRQALKGQNVPTFPWDQETP